MPLAWTFGIFLILGGIFTLSAAVYQTLTVTFAFSLFAVISTGYAILRALAIVNPKPTQKPIEEIIEDKILPMISILLPVYKEAHMIADLIRNIQSTDYPASRYEIFILCEPDDKATIIAASQVARPPVKLFITSGTGPKTKPNALNAALPHTIGDIITVYDAEDRPHPDQLFNAVRALVQNPECGVVQAPLDFYNARQNWLTSQFALEYAALFHVWLPYLERLGLPFPLGGTSNHIRRTALMSVNGWDAHNVTEDADLSFRLAAQGWTLGYILPPTQEEAVRDLVSWHQQRSRWMKGYMQTWAAHTATPWAPTAKGKQGQALKRFATLQLTLGYTLLSGLFHVPGLILICFAWIFGASSTALFGLEAMFLGCLSVSYMIGIYIGATGAKRAGFKPSWFALLTMPAYWLLLLPPTIQAVWELWYKPFHWNKTEHNVRRDTCGTDDLSVLKPADLQID